MAMYQCINFNQLEMDGVKSYRFLTVEVIHEPVINSQGNATFLVMDRASDSNRVLRCEVNQLPETWGLFCFKKGQSMILLDPNYKFQYEIILKIDDADKQIFLLERDQSYVLAVEKILESLSESCSQIFQVGQ